jgi:hypothetical protein
MAKGGEGGEVEEARRHMESQPLKKRREGGGGQGDGGKRGGRYVYEFSHGRWCGRRDRGEERERETEGKVRLTG